MTPMQHDGRHWRSQAAVYGTNRPAYDRENAGKTRTYRRKAAVIAERLLSSLTEPLQLLEIGCGTGLFTAELAGMIPTSTIVATDAFQPMLDVAGQRLAGCPNVTVRRWDGTAPMDGEGRFDAVCGVDVIHHIADPVAALRGWRRMVNDRGRLLFLETNPHNPIMFLRLRGRPEESRVFLNTRRNLMSWCAEGGWMASSARYQPFYLPSGPPSLHDLLSATEDVLHTARLARPLSALLLLEATAQCTS